MYATISYILTNSYNASLVATSSAATPQVATPPTATPPDATPLAAISPTARRSVMLETRYCYYISIFKHNCILNIAAAKAIAVRK